MIKLILLAAIGIFIFGGGLSAFTVNTSTDNVGVSVDKDKAFSAISTGYDKTLSLIKESTED